MIGYMHFSVNQSLALMFSEDTDGQWRPPKSFSEPLNLRDRIAPNVAFQQLVKVGGVLQKRFICLICAYAMGRHER